MHIIKEMVKPYVVLLHLMELYGYELLIALFPMLPTEEAIKMGLRETCADIPLDLRNIAALVVAAEINRAKAFDEDELSYAMDVIERHVKGSPIDIYGQASSARDVLCKGIIFCSIEEEIMAHIEGHQVTMEFEENVARLFSLGQSVGGDSIVPKEGPMLYEAEGANPLFSRGKRPRFPLPLAPFSSDEVEDEVDAEAGDAVAPVSVHSAHNSSVSDPASPVSRRTAAPADAQAIAVLGLMAAPSRVGGGRSDDEPTGPRACCAVQ